MDKLSVTRPDNGEHRFFTGGTRAESVLKKVLVTSPPRALILGTAGSGKSVLLHRLQRLLAARGNATSALLPTREAADVPPASTLIIDDLDLLPADRVDHVLERAWRLDRSLLVTARPWSLNASHMTAIHHLERLLPVVHLGYVTQDDIGAHLAGRESAPAGACASHLMELTGGIAWMVSAALTVHDGEPCDDPVHSEAQDFLTGKVLHSLARIDHDLRASIERVSIIGQDALAADPRLADDIVAKGVSSGLLLRDGTLPEVVRAAVLTMTPSHRLLEVVAWKSAHERAEAPSARDPDGSSAQMHVAQLVAGEARAQLRQSPQAAQRLFARALDAGMDPRQIRDDRAIAAWCLGELDMAAELCDDAISEGSSVSDALLGISAGVWSARCMMAVSSDTYLMVSEHAPNGAVLADLAHVGHGLPDRLHRSGTTERPVPVKLPTTLSVALALLDRGIGAVLQPQAEPAALRDLVRASDLYTSSREFGPIVELPAVIAALTALGSGDPETAESVLTSALHRGHGGRWARRRLLLWQALVTLQIGTPAQVQDLLESAETEGFPPSPRDEVLAATARLVFARRYEDTAALAALWNRVKPLLFRVQFDVYLVRHLAELIMIAAKLGDEAALGPQMSASLQVLRNLGSPSPWSTHLHWAGVQQGILLNKPELVPPHAQALVSLSQRSPLAAALADAGRVWSSVLGKSFDPDEVEAAAKKMAAFGMAWDGARLAGSAASRSANRAVKAHLLGTARHLHPTLVPAADLPSKSEAPVAAPQTARSSVRLSDREMEIARHVVSGRTYSEVGAMLYISPRTVEHHMARMRERVGASSRAELLASLRHMLDGSAPAET